MSKATTNALVYLTKQEQKKVLLDWFNKLNERNAFDSDGQRVNGRAWRAELRRAELPYGSMLCEGYSELCYRLGKVMPLSAVDKMALSLFASIAVHIKKHTAVDIKKPNEEISFAAQLGEKQKHSSPCVSKLRFECLIRAKTPDEFGRLLIQAVKIRGSEGCNVISLMDSLFIWMREWENAQQHLPEPANPFERNRVRWTCDYLSASR